MIEYELFPVGPTIEECREATQGFPGFREQKKEDYISFNYDFAFRESFPDPTTEDDPKKKRLLMIRRECRGIIFSVSTGAILARRFHKFFNVSEIAETMPDKIDISRPHLLLNKLDGCLVTPFMTNGQMRFGTKLGITQVTDYLEKKFFPTCGINYHDFCIDWLQKNYTPLFEWISPAHQVILEYTKETLYLTGLRENNSGIYVNFEKVLGLAKEAGIPVVELETQLLYGRDYGTMEELVERVRERDGIEGCVLMFDQGEMYKLKSRWYIEKSKRANRDLSLFEKDLWLLVLDKGIDDVADILGERRRKILEDFGMKLFITLQKNAEKIQETIDQAKAEKMEKKEFVEKMNHLAKSENSDPFMKNHVGLYFKVYDGADPLEEIVKFLRLQCKNIHKLDLVRNTLCGGLKVSL